MEKKPDPSKLPGLLKACDIVEYNGYRNQICKMDPHQAKELIKGSLAKILIRYGQKSDFDPILVKELMDDILERWSHLGVDELKHAFQLWSAGEIGDRNAEMYGVFNATVLNRVLAAYEKHRAEVINRELQKQRDMEFEKNEEQKRAEYQASLDAMTDDDIRAEVEKCSTYDQIPEWVLIQVSKRKLIRIDLETQAEYRERAREMAAIQLKNEYEDARVLGMRTVARSFESELEAKLSSREDWIYKRLITFENL